MTTRAKAELTGSISGLTNEDKVEKTVKYFDGLGRSIQDVRVKGSPDKHDMIAPYAYDTYGRQVKKYLPYKGVGDLGNFNSSPFTAQNAFYDQHFQDNSGDYAFSEDLYEASPLNTVIRQAHQGQSWSMSGSHTLDYVFRFNTTNEVRLITADLSGYITASSYYGANQLRVQESTNENSGTAEGETIEFTNGLGKVVLTKIKAEGGYNSLYSIYDPVGRLVYVLQPGGVKEIIDAGGNWSYLNNASFQERWMFSYQYDERNRMTAKRVPGADWEYMVYDEHDRTVLTQKAQQRSKNEWSFMKYDDLNRIAMTGLISSANSRTAMQIQADAAVTMNTDTDPSDVGSTVIAHSITLAKHEPGVQIYRAKESVEFLPGFNSDGQYFETDLVSGLTNTNTFFQGYDDNTFPSLRDYNGEVLAMNFYDDYDFTDLTYESGQEVDFYSTGTDEAVNPHPHSNAISKVTGSKNKVLGSDNQWLTGVMYYDDRDRVIQTTSDNHLGGRDIRTSQFDFDGDILNVYVTHANPAASGAQNQTTVSRRFKYNHIDQLLWVKQKLNGSGTHKEISSYAYNDLGLLESKTLGSNLETLEFDYNIRGWLEGVNADYATSGTGTHFFGMKLSYDQGHGDNQYNGNVAGAIWRTPSSPSARAYDYHYDPSNRIKAADYAEGSGWSQNVGAFSATYGYDANGNLNSLMRKGLVAGSIEIMDQLTYQYTDQNGKNSNRLVNVIDAGDDYGLGDFKDGNTGVSDDYVYDDSGNMIKDRNKGLETIVYNHLNLPEKVTFTNGNSIMFTYDAAGIKLNKVVSDGNSTKTTDYVGDFIYENNELIQFSHNEGRVRRKSNGNLVYDYVIKDHIGNGRVTITEDLETVSYEATMETANETVENETFLNLTQTKSSEEAFQGTFSAKVGPQSIGPAKMLAVMAGDEVDLRVYAKYPNSFGGTDVGNPATIGSLLAATFGATGGGATYFEQGVYNRINANAGSFLASIGNGGVSSVPKAYLNYVFFDQDFNYKSAYSGYEPVTANSKGGFYIVQENGIQIPESGYLFVYVSNEGEAGNGGNVYFDALRIDHKKGNLIQEDHYYPFGMNMNALSATAPMANPNRYKYNGKEFNADLDLSWYDYQARQYDPQLGRWHVVDPSVDTYLPLSPYNYVYNNPLRLVDPDGADPWDVLYAAMEYLGIPYELGGKNPVPIPLTLSFWGGQRSINSEQLVSWFIFEPAGSAGGNYEMRRMFYANLGVSDVFNRGSSFGIDCSGLAAKAFNADPDKLMDDFNPGFHNAHKQMLAFKSAEKVGKGLLHENFNLIGAGDLVFTRFESDVAKHVVIATGQVIKDDEGNVVEYQVIEAPATGREVEFTWRKPEEGHKIGHTFRKTDLVHPRAMDLVVTPDDFILYSFWRALYQINNDDD